MISVCMPTYNGEKFIKEQLESILAQLAPEDEVIISDDSSTDKTIQIIKSFSDERIKLFENNIFSSPIFNLENALKKAKGDVIILSDQDDIWEKDKVRTLLYHINKFDLVVSDCQVINETNEIIYDSFFALRNSGKGFMKNLFKNSYLGCCMGFKRSVLEYVLPFPKKIPMHDIWIGLLIELIGKSHFIDDKLIKYRRHGLNASFGGENSGFSLYFQLYYRFHVIILLANRFIKIKLFKRK